MPKFKKAYLLDLQLQEIDECFLIHVSKKGYNILPLEWTENSGLPFLQRGILKGGRDVGIRVWFLWNVVNRVSPIPKPVSDEKLDALTTKIEEFMAR